MFVPIESRPAGEEPEMPKRPELPHAVKHNIRGAEEALYALAWAKKIRLDRTGHEVQSEIHKVQLDIITLNERIEATKATMFQIMTDNSIPLGCHDPMPHVDAETANAYIDAVRAEINSTVNELSGQLPKELAEAYEKLPKAWNPEQFSHWGMGR